jgi:cell division cycle 20-like protein 1 (cofactor of APC complex)
MNAQYEARLQSPKKSPPKRLSGVSYDEQTSARRKLIFSSKEMYYDRMIPSLTAANLEASFSLLPTQKSDGDNLTKPLPSLQDSNSASKALYKQVLQNELLGTSSVNEESYSQTPPQTVPRSSHHSIGPGGSTEVPLSLSPTRLLSYKSKKPFNLNDSTYSLSPISVQSQQLLSSPKKAQRKIPKVPYKVLEAPQIQDDFYLNLVDWSNLNLLAVGLGKSVYLWNATTSQVTSLCEVSHSETVTSLSWMNRGTHLAVGSSEGAVTLWDVTKQRKIRTFFGHKARVGTIAWGQSPEWILSTGSRDRTILQRDVRTEKHFVSRLTAHKQEVCGLKWGYNPANLLVSGGNDNKLFVWDQRISREEKNISVSVPLYSFLSHKAAVKGLTWSPHQRGLLASGGGTADQTIRFWNTITGQELSTIDTGSQVCNLAWSKNVNEFVSTHGYSQNQITIWSYPSLNQIATLTGHTMRVLYLSVSPDGQTIVTGAGDETLRFWSIFPKPKASCTGRDLTSSLKNSWNDIR